MAIITRRRLFSAAAACVGTCAYAFAVEPDWIETSFTKIPLVPSGGHTIRILHLTDLHSSPVVPMERIARAIDLGLAENPDVICLTGDFVTSGDLYDATAYIATLRRLPAARPTFAVLGNHDGGRRSLSGEDTPVARMLAQANIELLHNRSRWIQIGQSSFHLVGVGDLWGRQVFPDAAFSGVPAGGSVILLAHNPDSKDILRRHRWDLMLSGHTHGGQVVIPIAGPPYVPVNDRRYISGLGEWEGRSIYVSRGVGSLHTLRFFCRPEVTILDVEVA